MLNLDKRLEVCAEMVQGGGLVCDIGTDHAYLPVYLVMNGICSGAIASDINSGPLEFAGQTVEKYGCGDKVKLNRADGLENIDLEGVRDIVIAGMGGETIAKILDRQETRKKGLNFVLQPMTKAAHLRKWLYKNGFEIVCEKAVREDRFIYTVIRAVYTGVSIDIGLTPQIIGRININTPEGNEYCTDRYKKMNNIALGLAKAG